MPVKNTKFVAFIIIIILLLAGCSTQNTATSAVTLPATAIQSGTTNTATEGPGVRATNSGPANPYPPSGEPPLGAAPSVGGPAYPPPGGTPAGNPTGGGQTGASGGSGTGAADAKSGLATATGVFTLDGKTDTQTSQTYTASHQDQSGVYVLNGGNLTLNDPTVTTSGDTSSDANSSFYGLNAGVLAASGSAVTLNNGSISTTGSSANGAFATGSQTVMNLVDLTIQASGDGGHGAMASQGGAINLNNVTITTHGANAAPIATDRGGGTITATGGSVTSTGQDSPCYYSTGVLTIDQNTCQANNSEAAVIEGANSIILTDSSLASDVANKWGVLIYQSFSGDALGSDGVFTMTNGSLTSTSSSSPLFYVTNTRAHISLQNVTLTTASGILLQAEGNDRWGTSGANGGTVDFIANGQTLSGDIVADSLSSVNLTLENSTILTGAINAAHTAQAFNLTLDASSTWNVAADSYITCLSDPAISGSTISNINSNGHTVYYDPTNCVELGGLTYTLNDGGVLTPAPASGG